MRSQEAQVAMHRIDVCLALVVGEIFRAHLLQLSATLFDAETAKGLDDRVTEVSKMQATTHTGKGKKRAGCAKGWMKVEAVLGRAMAEKAGWFIFYRQRLPVKFLLESSILTAKA